MIRSYEESGWRFATSSDGSQISVKQIGLDSCRMHVSLVGRPWVRRQVLILEDLAYKDKLISSICEDVYNLHLADNKIIYLVTNDLLSCHTTSDIQKVFNKLTNFHEDAISPKTLRLFEHMQSLLRDDKRLLEELSFKESGSFHSAYGNDGNDTGNYYTP